MIDYFGKNPNLELMALIEPLHVSQIVVDSFVNSILKFGKGNFSF